MIHQPLVRGIGVWLAIKAAALAAIFLLFFGPHNGPEAAGDGAGQGAGAIVAHEGAARVTFEY